MAMTYSQFKTYILDTLWRVNDTALANNLDTIIRQANNELNKLTRDWQRRQQTENILPTSQDYQNTFGSVLSVTSNSPDTYYQTKAKTFQRTTLSHVYELRAQNPGGPLLPWYATDVADSVKYLRLVGPSLSASNTGDLIVVYRMDIPDYATTDESWFEDEYLDLYAFTVYKHCAIFVREDERIQTYASLQTEAFRIADEDDKHNLQWGGSPLVMRPHHPVP